MFPFIILAGFCFVSFDSEDTVDKICELQFHHIDGNKVEVKRALPKEVQQQQAALRAAVAGRGMIPTIGGCMSVKYFSHYVDLCFLWLHNQR